MQFSALFVLSFLTTIQGFVVGPTFSTSIGTDTTFLKNSAVSDTETKISSSATETMILFSPCKINLFLRIIRKREDGYHDLASLFQAIGFGDTLELTPLEDSASNDIFTCNMEGVPTDSSNLVIRALELMREKTGVTQYFQANLIKQVPAQAGLGGGSANAATAMWGANELMGKPASLDQVRYLPTTCHVLPREFQDLFNDLKHRHDILFFSFSIIIKDD